MLVFNWYVAYWYWYILLKNLRLAKVPKGWSNVNSQLLCSPLIGGGGIHSWHFRVHAQWKSWIVNPRGDWYFMVHMHCELWIFMRGFTADISGCAQIVNCESSILGGVVHSWQLKVCAHCESSILPPWSLWSPTISVLRTELQLVFNNNNCVGNVLTIVVIEATDCRTYIFQTKFILLNQ